METRLNQGLLKQVETLQTKYPQLIVGGSVALFLHGVRLKRWDMIKSDLDLITPYYTLIEEGIYERQTNSGADFDYSVNINGVKVDVRIDPKARYEVIKFGEFSYKVAPLLQIIEAKVRYALKGNQKHVNDLNKMILNK